MSEQIESLSRMVYGLAFVLAIACYGLGTLRGRVERLERILLGLTEIGKEKRDE